MRERLRSERGDGVISVLLAFGLLLVIVVFAIQAIGFAHVRSVAQAAAQDGAETAASEGPAAGIARAEAVLRSAGGAAKGLHPAVSTTANVVTVQVSGNAPHVLPGVSLVLPTIVAHASTPLERYPQNEQ
jgi:uncharacterized protein (UPF0333 family)